MIPKMFPTDPHQHPLEFWGQALLNAAAWQRQIEWLMRLNPISEPLAGRARNSESKENTLPGITRPPSSGVNDSIAAAVDGYGYWLKLYGWVPRRDLEQLQARYDALEERYLQQKEMITRMQQATGFDPGSLIEGFSQMLSRQGNEFERLMNNLRAAAAISPAQEDSREI